MHRLRYAVLAAALFPFPGAAQTDDEFASSAYWYDVQYPKLFFTSRDGLGVGGHYAIIQDFSASEYGNPASYKASLAANGLLTTKGSRQLSLVFSAPALVDRWRLFGELSGERWNRDDYYGVGNNTEFDADNVTDQQPYFYRAQRDRFRLRGEVQRVLTNHVRILGGFNVDRARLAPLAGPSVLAMDMGTFGTDIGTFSTDVAFRTGIILDTRDDEVAPETGVFVEAIVGLADADFLGDVSYTRTTVTARGYVRATPRLTFAGRVTGQGMTGSPNLSAMYLVEESEGGYDGMGGSRSHRAIRQNRLLGRNKLLGNAEARVLLYGIPTLVSIKALFFVDAGRVFEPTAFRLTTSDLAVGGGTGLMFQIGRRLVAGGTAGSGPDGVVFGFHTQWSY